MSKILIISGSPSKVSRTEAISTYIRNILKEGGNQVEKLVLRELPAEALVHAQFNHPEIKKAQKLVEESDALVVVSPIYKASYPGMLKSFFDLIPEKGLVGKKVLPITSGGTISHLLSLEYAFKPLFSILGAREIFQGVYLVDSQVSYSEDEITFMDEQMKERLEWAINELQSALEAKVVSVLGGN
ncbi:NADPH-dependent FMN reductase [Neobacillus thermocopriae]|uniref:NADPH-dependent FMN reductase n=1 Tax=Neobacillus thermocopriae TaxID=1215031 RepID=A0A6B3TUP1_9BACI|nr:NADPH-dependent FMN reductase [Neobacillus thermocopriae]MED3623541.1 NADPH-dependent FMN reductase [Neobacillus thermocopriae]MED3714441.1 NADPH-dependent FMN reductase [Neobacillus thermocopriae]NEX80188.1 NADPH-dependent FMN reductase [Neobacillus thermocopriae]